MAIEAGKVTIAVGEFIAISKDGSQRVLKVGDTVYEGEIIKSNGGTQIEIVNGDQVYSGGSDANFILEGVGYDESSDLDEDSIDKEISELIGEDNETNNISVDSDTKKAPFEDEPILDDKTAAVSGEVDDKTAAVSGESKFFYTGGGGGGGSVAARFVTDTTGVDGVGAHAEAMMASSAVSSSINAGMNCSVPSGSNEEVESNSLPTVWLTQDGETVEEGGCKTYTVNISKPYDYDTRVVVEVGHITTDDGDIKPITKVVTIPAGATSATFDIENIDDNLIENDESYRVTIVDVDNQDLSIDQDQSSVMTTIIDNDFAKVSLVQDKEHINEGESNSYTLTLDRPNESDTTVTVTVGHITTEDGDVIPVTKDIVIPAGETQVTFSVETLDDDLVEGSEDFKVFISSVDGDKVTVDEEQSEVITTIDDNDKAVVCIVQDNTSVNESDTHTYRLELDKPTEFDTTVKVVVGHITTDDGDVAPLTKEVVIPAGETSAIFTLDALDDNIAESNEEFSVTIDSVDSDFVEISPTQNSVTTTIVDDDIAKVSLTQEKDSINEGDTQTYTLTLDKPSDTDTTVRVVVGHITTDDGDIAPLTKEVVIPAGETSATFTVEAVDDDIVEQDEDFKVTIDSIDSDKVVIDPEHKEVTTTILNDDYAKLSITAEKDSINEGDTQTYTLHLSSPSDRDTTAKITVGHITTDDGDVVAVTKDIVIPAGKTEVTFTVDSIDDDIVEQDEEFKVSIDGIDNPDVKIDETQSEVTTTIVDNDKAVVCITQDSTSVNEGESHTYTISMDKASTADTTVKVQVGHITTDDGDVAPLTKEVVIPAGETSVTFIVEAIDDIISEDSENFKVSIVEVNGINSEISSTQNEVITTIIDDDTSLIKLTQDVDSIDEGSSNTYIVSMDKPSEFDTTITVQVGHITTDDGDVVAVTKDIVIPAGETSVSFTVDTLDDSVVEGAEEFKVTLVSTDNTSTVIDAENKEVVTTINDNDSAKVSITQVTDSVDEGSSHTYTLTLSDISDKDTTVTVSVGHITTDDGDVTPVTRDIVIPAGQKSVNFDIDINNDNLVEGNEQYKVEIINVDADSISVDETKREVTTTIVDDDKALVSISQDTQSVVEGETHTYTISLDKPTSEDTVVTVSVGHITTEDGDVSPLTRQVVIPAGETSATFALDAVGDMISEGDEEFRVSIVDVDGLNTQIDSTQSSVITTIVDDDISCITLAQEGNSVEEGASHSYIVSMDKPSEFDTTVTVQVGHITTEDGDIAPLTKEVVIPAGETSATFTVEAIDDDIVEDSEDFKVIEVSTNNSTTQIDENHDEVITTIKDNDTGVVSISQIGGEQASEGTSHTYRLQLDKVSDKDLTVTIQVGHITTDDGDVSPLTRDIIIPAGQNSVEFSLDILDDNIVENSERFEVCITDIDDSRYSVDSQHSSVITTINDQTRSEVTISQSSDSVTESNSHEYTITLDKAQLTDTKVTVQVENITTEDGDVSPLTQEVIIPAGETCATFTLDAVDDIVVEGAEDYRVVISSVDSDSIDIGSQNSVTTTIVDNDDSKVYITQDNTDVDEGDSHTYTLHLTNPLETDTTVTVQVGNITTDDGDVTPVTRDIVIPAGETSATFTVSATDDDIVECDEDFNVKIVSSDNGVSIDSENDEVVTTIDDNDCALVSLSQDGTSVDEGETHRYTLSLDKVNQEDTNVVIRISHIDTDERDLHAETRTITIPAGSTSVSFDISNIDDSIMEGNEDYKVSIESVESCCGDENKVAIDPDASEVVTTINENDWSGDWSSDWSSDWASDWSSDWSSDWASDWSSDWSSDCWSSNYCWGDDPITVLEDGGYIVPFLATSDVDASDGDGYGVFFQRYDAEGNKVGEPQLANTTTQGDQFEADVAALKDGGYVLAWQSSVGDGSGNGIFLQRYDAQGNKVGQEVQVNTTTQGDQSQVVITGLKDGGYAVAWQSENSDGDGYGIFVQKFDAYGAKVGGEILVNETTVANQTMPAIDTLEDGSFVVTWQSNSSGSSETYSRVFDANMSASNEIQINTSEYGEQTLPMVSGLKDGGFVSTWISYDGDDASVMIQRFDNMGNKIGDETVVSKLTDFDLYSNVSPEVAGLNDGGYVVVFADKDGDGSGVYYQRYDANGEAMGDRVLINEDETSNQYNPHITELNDGGFLTTWVNVSEDNSSMEVVGQRFDANGNRVDEIFKVSEITTDKDEVQNLLETHEVNEINTVDYLDFDAVAAQNETVSANDESSNHDTQNTEDVTLQDLVSDFKDEIEMDLPEEPKDETPATQQHQIAPAVIPEMTQEITDINDNQNLIDITQHQVVVDDV